MDVKPRRKVFVIKGRMYKLFNTSIQVEGVPNFVFYGRPVEEKDARTLAAIAELGRGEIKVEFKTLLDL